MIILLLLAEGRLVNLGNATGHPSRIMDGSFANQVLAQIELYKRQFATQDSATQAKMLKVEVLPKHLDEEVARYMVAGFGGVMTKLTQEQADYIGVAQEGPYQAGILSLLINKTLPRVQRALGVMLDR